MKSELELRRSSSTSRFCIRISFDGSYGAFLRKDVIPWELRLKVCARARIVRSFCDSRGIQNRAHRGAEHTEKREEACALQGKGWRLVMWAIRSKDYFLFGLAGLWHSFSARALTHRAIYFASVASILTRRSNRLTVYEFSKLTRPGFFYIQVGSPRSASFGLVSPRNLPPNLQ
jgi:hypothetical protein